MRSYACITVELNDSKKKKKKKPTDEPLQSVILLFYQQISIFQRRLEHGTVKIGVSVLIVDIKIIKIKIKISTTYISHKPYTFNGSSTSNTHLCVNWWITKFFFFVELCPHPNTHHTYHFPSNEKLVLDKYICKNVRCARC